MDEPLFLEDWFPPDPPSDDDDDWFDCIEDPYPLEDPDLESEPLRVAIVANDLESVQALLAEGVDPNSYDEVVPLLSIASRRGVVEIVKALLEAGASPNLHDDEGHTPLMCASGAGHLAIVHALINAGANIHAEDKDGNSALSSAAWAGQIEMVEYLLPLASEEDRKYADSYRKYARDRLLEK